MMKWFGVVFFLQALAFANLAGAAAVSVFDFKPRADYPSVRAEPAVDHERFVVAPEFKIVVPAGWKLEYRAFPSLSPKESARSAWAQAYHWFLNLWTSDQSDSSREPENEAADDDPKSWLRVSSANDKDPNSELSVFVSKDRDFFEKQQRKMIAEKISNPGQPVMIRGRRWTHTRLSLTPGLEEHSYRTQIEKFSFEVRLWVETGDPFQKRAVLMKMMESLILEGAGRS